MTYKMNEHPSSGENSGRAVTLEQNKRLSECLLWRMEREYFERKGIEAWLHDVPYYVTSNPFIAKAYAKVVIHFIRDWVSAHPDAKNHPFYLLELGTGPGQFSYHMVKVLDEMRLELGMHDIKIVYIMSDFAKANLDYHQQHTALIPFVEKGLLDFAIQDMDKGGPIKLAHSKVELNQKTLVNPLTCFANYLFDTISNDSFCVQNGKLYELLVDLSTDESNLENNRPVELEKVNVSHHVREINGPYYNEPELDAVLELYRTSLKDTSFLMPIGSIRGLNNLRKLANGRLVMISSDKAYSDIASLEGLGFPTLTIHGGCFSMMVNCHAIGEYFKNCGGVFIPQSSRRGLKTCFYTTGFTLENMPETRAAVNEYIERYSPTDFFNVYRHMNETAQYAELDSIASYLQMTEWDPRAYSRISSHILAKITDGNADIDTINFMASNMHRLAENYYYMPKADCILFEVGVFFHALKRYDLALHYYKQAEKYLPEQFNLKYNIALCLHHLNQNEEALENFKLAARLDPDSQEAKEWIEYLGKQLMEKKLEPKRVSERKPGED